MVIIKSYKTSNKKGISLIEVLLYVVLCAIVVVAGVSFFSIVQKKSLKDQVIANIGNEAKDVIHLINCKIREAKSVETPTSDSPSNSLSLRMLDPNKDPTVFSINENGILTMKEGLSDPVSLTDDRVIINNTNSNPYIFSVTPGSHDQNVSYTFNLKANTTNPNYEYNYSKDFTAGSTLRIGSNISNISNNSTYTLTYHGNGNTGGTAPTDSNTYEAGNAVTILNNTGNIIKTGYTFSGWNTTADGTGTDYMAGSTFNMGSGNVILYANWATIVVSDPCDGTPPIGTVCTGGSEYAGIFNSSKYMTTPSDAGVMVWANETVVTGATSMTDGASNTNNLANRGAGYAAATYCQNLVFGGYSDLYLPAKDELNSVLYVNRVAIGGFYTENTEQSFYFSSTEGSDYSVHGQLFGNGASSSSGKTFGRYVRCVRKY